MLEGTDAVLVEVPFTGQRRAAAGGGASTSRPSGLRPLIAHPERAESVLERPSLARDLVERGWSLQVNATSLLGRHGPEIEALAWGLVDDDVVAVVASDGHRPLRPPHLDEAYAAVRVRVGETRARSLFDGRRSGSLEACRPLPSRAAARGG